MCHLQEIYAKYKSKGLVVLGIDPADDKKIALDLLRENGATFPNVIDDSKAARRVTDRDYPMAGWPTTYLIGRDGKVVAAWAGFEEGYGQALAALQKADKELKAAIQEDWDAAAAKAAKDVTAAAERLFQAIRAADYNRDWATNEDWKWFPAKGVEYIARDRARWVRWTCLKLKAEPIIEVRLAKVFAGPDGKPTVPFELRLESGKTLGGNLPFVDDPRKKQWIGWQGLDWHVRKPLPSKTAAK
jgi:hypothetical protein